MNGLLCWGQRRFPVFALGATGLLESLMTFPQRPLRSWLLALLLASPPWALAADVHYNQMHIQREGANKFAFSLSLNLTHLLHQVLAPQSSLADFLKTYSDAPDKVLQTALAKAGSELGQKSFMVLPTGAKVGIRDWQFPPLAALRESLKAHAFLLEIPSSTPPHVPPMLVQAQGHSKTPVGRAQLQVHKVLHPLWVVQPHDQLWLTEQIPLAVVTFE
jgi:hypothetical protein